MNQRVYMAPGRVSVSKRGYDVLAVPRTSDYMAIDSSLQIVRPLQAGVLFSVPLNNGFTQFSFGTTYPTPPAMELYQWDGGVLETRYNIYRLTSGSTVNVRNAFNCGSTTTYFTISGAPGGAFVDTSFENQPRHWVWIAWPTS